MMGSTRLFARVLRYGVVGLGISIVYSLAVVLLVDHVHMRSATWASVLAFAVMLPFAYAAHRRVTFFDAARDTFQPARFAVTTTSSFLVSTVGMYGVTEVFGFSYLIGIALNWALVPAINFLIYFIWVFRVGKRPVLAEIAPGGAPRSRWSLDGD